MAAVPRSGAVASMGPHMEPPNVPPPLARTIGEVPPPAAIGVAASGRWIWRISPAGLSPSARLAWGAVAAVCAALLAAAARLEPDPRGLGTHEQFGMPPCSFVLTSGLPCPTCGMTTAFAELMHGRPWRAFQAQPAGTILCVAAVVLCGVAGAAATTGRLLVLNWDRLGPVRVSLGVGLLILGGWAWKLVHGLLDGTLPMR